MILAFSRRNTIYLHISCTFLYASRVVVIVVNSANSTFLGGNSIWLCGLAAWWRGGLYARETTQQNTPFPKQTKHEISHTNTEKLTVKWSVLNARSIPGWIPPLRRRRYRCDPHRPPFSSNPSLALPAEQSYTETQTMSRRGTTSAPAGPLH